MDLSVLLMLLLYLWSCRTDPQILTRDRSIHDRMISAQTFERRGSALDIQRLLIWDEDANLSFYSSDSLDFKLDSMGILSVSSRAALPVLSYFTIRKEEKKLDIPFYASDKQSIAFSLRDSNRRYKSVSLIGEMTNWQTDPVAMEWSEGSWKVKLDLSPGSYAYKFVADGKEMVDPNAHSNQPNGIGGINSIREVRKPHLGTPPKLFWRIIDNEIRIRCSDSTATVLAFLNNQAVELAKSNQNTYTLPHPVVESGDRDYLRILSANNHGPAPQVLIPLNGGKVVEDSSELTNEDFHTLRMYFLMVDRFKNGNKKNDRITPNPEIHPKAQFQGGDLEGVAEVLEQGYFDSLHINLLWLSPIVENPAEAYGLWDKGGVRSRFSAYHGYWPISFTNIDSRFGSSDDLLSLVEMGASREIGLLLDFVANHVHENHWVYQEHPDWATDLYLPDGSLNTELWDEQRLTTWFDTFLPSLRLDQPEIAEMLADSALFWIEKYGVLGFRHDATKHIPLSFWKRLSKKIREYELSNNRSILQIGETYGAPDLIKSYIGYGLLDAQFDFNLYDAAISNICHSSGETNMTDLASRLRQSLDKYGQHHLMGNMSGNQDKPRAMSLATGEVSLSEDTKLAGWTSEIKEQTKEGFERLALLHAFNFAIPGIPVVYYGDEIGFPGGNDPDNRDMMQFDDLSSQEAQLRETVADLSAFRESSLPMQYGTTEIVFESTEMLILKRSYGQNSVLCLFNASNTVQKENIKAMKRDCVIGDPLFCESLLDSTTLEIKIPPRSFSFIPLKACSYEN